MGRPLSGGHPRPSAALTWIRSPEQIDVLGIEVEKETVIPIQTLNREPGGIAVAKGRTRRWFWSRYRQGDAMGDHDVAA